MAASAQKQSSGPWQTLKPFVNGGLSGIAATCVMQPVDIVKVRSATVAHRATGSHAAGAAGAARGNPSPLCEQSPNCHASPPPLPLQVRLQIAGGGSPIALASELIKKEGFATLYTGLSAGVLRQITYTSSRLGIFKCAPRWLPRVARARLSCAAAGGAGR